MNTDSEALTPIVSLTYDLLILHRWEGVVARKLVKLFAFKLDLPLERLRWEQVFQFHKTSYEFGFLEMSVKKREG